MRRGWLALVCLWLGACAAPQAVVPVLPPPLADERFGVAPRLPDAEALFALSAQMRDFAATQLRGRHMQTTSALALVDALYNSEKLQLRYDDSGPTRSAAEAFADRRGNCLSLVLMTAAFAKALDLQVDYRQVHAAGSDAWRSSGALLVHDEHVNIVLAPSRVSARRVAGRDEALVIDFLPQQQAAELRSRSLDERTLVAMYYNNRAAETLADASTPAALALAYWWSRAAVLQAPGWAPALNTLGVVHQRAGLPALAEAAWAAALVIDGANIAALSNLEQALQTAGRSAEAASWHRRRMSVESAPLPIEPLAQARTATGGTADASAVREALGRRDADAALRLAERQAARSGLTPELLLLRAEAHLALGHDRQAQTALAKAAALTPDAEERRRWLGRLALLAGSAPALRGTP